MNSFTHHLKKTQSSKCLENSNAVLWTCKPSVFLHRHVVQTVAMLLSDNYYHQEAWMVLGDHLFVAYICA